MLSFPTSQNSAAEYRYLIKLHNVIRFNRKKDVLFQRSNHPKNCNNKKSYNNDACIFVDYIIEGKVKKKTMIYFSIFSCKK